MDIRVYNHVKLSNTDGVYDKKTPIGEPLRVGAKMDKRYVDILNKSLIRIGEQLIEDKKATDEFKKQLAEKKNV